MNHSDGGISPYFVAKSLPIRAKLIACKPTITSIQEKTNALISKLTLGRMVKGPL